MPLSWESDDEDDLDEGGDVGAPSVPDDEATVRIPTGGTGAVTALAMTGPTRADPPNQPGPQPPSGTADGNRAARPHVLGRGQLAALGLAAVALLVVATILLLAHHGAPANTASARPLAQPVPAGQVEPSGRSQPDVSPTTGPTTTTGTAASSGSPAKPLKGDLALHRPVTASGHTGNYVPSNAVDDNPDSYWESAEHMFPQYIEVDLGSAQTIGRVELRLPRRASWPARVQTIQIVGDNGTIAGMRAYDFEPANGNVVNIMLPPTSTRYVRVVFAANSGSPAAQLSALRVFAAG